MIVNYMLQLPYITHGDDVVADSTFIIKYLEATYGRPPPYSSLRPLNRHQQAIAAACMAITSDRLTQGLMYYRFVPEEVRTGLLQLATGLATCTSLHINSHSCRFAQPI